MQNGINLKLVWFDEVNQGKPTRSGTQFTFLKSSRSLGEKCLYRPVSISLSRANGGISRRARIALSSSGRRLGFGCVVERATR